MEFIVKLFDATRPMWYDFYSVPVFWPDYLFLYWLGNFQLTRTVFKQESFVEKQNIV